MSHSNDQSLGEAIRDFLQAYGLEEKYNQTKIIQSWEKVMGKMISVHTKDLHIHNRILFVRIDSPALRNELTFAREEILKRLNEAANGSVIDDIVIKG